MNGRHDSGSDELGEAMENGESLCTGVNGERQCLLCLSGNQKSVPGSR